MNTNIRSSRVPFWGASGIGCGARQISRRVLPYALVTAVLLGAGCSSVSLNGAPVEDKGTSQLAIPLDQPAKQPLGFENAGKPGYYTIKPGDTIIRIGQTNGQNWRDIVRWNNLENHNLIEVGQVLRVAPPVTNTQTNSSTSTGTRSTASAINDGKSAISEKISSTADDNVGWIWPAQGTLLAGFNEVKNKGLDIAGKGGDNVIASADGRVVYAGSGLRGYGNLIILKHNDTYLTAYAHNRTLLVKEDQSVKKGQKIAEMGSSDTDRVKLHFEIRRQGKPVDPAKYLPAK